MKLFDFDDLDSLIAPESHDIACSHEGGQHRIRYWEWSAGTVVGRADAGRGLPELRQTVFCVHGLTRTGRDFDVLASRLSRAGHRVIAPDMAGRGHSEWLADASMYALPQYIADCLSLIARLELENLAWVGTSMGGLIGMAIASMPQHPIHRLLLNDIGAEVPAAGLQRIAESLRSATFDSFEAGEQALKSAMQNFGPHSEAAFRVLSRHYVIERDGQWVYHYDPRIGEPFEAALTGEALSIWPLYEAIMVPVTLMRGELSDVLSDPVAVRMAACGPQAMVHEISGVGHAPTLIDENQCRVVDQFLAE